MRIIAAVSAKGGVGKTTLSASLAEALAMAGERVFAVDLDPQNALRLHFGMPVDDAHGHARASLAGVPWQRSVFEGRSRVRVLPFGALNEADRANFESCLAGQPDWLRTQLCTLGLGHDDIVWLDTPPGPSPYVRQALSCAHVCVMVSLPDVASYASVPLMEDLIRTWCEGRPDYLGDVLVINQMDAGRQLARDVAQVLGAQAGDRLLGLVHRDEAVAEALAHDRSVLAYAPHSQATHDLQQCAARLRRMLAAQGACP